MPSESDKEGFGAACGRGVYTTRFFQKSVEYAINHLLGGEDDWLQMTVIKVVLVIAIPGISAPVQGKWVRDEEARKGKRYKLVAVRGTQEEVEQTQQRGKLDKEPTTGHVPRWTMWNSEDVEEETSSVAFLLGFYVLLAEDRSLMVKRLIRGRKNPHQGFLGWDPKLEPPLGRPCAPEQTRGLRSRSRKRASEEEVQQEEEGQGEGKDADKDADMEAGKGKGKVEDKRYKRRPLRDEGAKGARGRSRAGALASLAT